MSSVLVPGRKKNSSPDESSGGDGNASIRKVPAVTRAIAILRLLGHSKEPLGVNSIARELGFVPSTVLHILRVLTAEKFVSFDENTKRYELDVGVITLAGNAVRRNSFIRAVQPGLDRISDKFNMTMLASRLIDNEYSVVLAIAPSSLPFRLYTEIGSRFPALISASGRCLAAFGKLKRSELEKSFNRLKWARPPSFKEWLAQVEETKVRGYGIDQGNFLAGVTIVAVPFLEADQVTHTIVAVGLHEQFADIGVEVIAQEIQLLVEDLARNYSPHA